MNPMGDWRYVYASVPGVAHRAQETPCQDACAVGELETVDGTPALVLVAADGAGSATAARAGAELACQALLTECTLSLRQTAIADWTRTSAELLIERVQALLSQRAAETGLPLREFACTLLGAVLTEEHALFLQIGDGAIVISTGAEYWPVFWPQAGQYANETYFATDANASIRLEFATSVQPIAEIALLTDGLQPLALHYQTRQAHTPFFRPLFQHLRAAPEPGCPADLMSALARFLDTPTLNQRTHDDKTLILATRLAAAANQPLTPPTVGDPTDTKDATDATEETPAATPAAPQLPPREPPCAEAD